MSKKNKNKKKMNFLYKIAFILSLMCIPLLVISLIVAYAQEQPGWSVLFSGSGAFLAFIGIILGMVSKPKKPKKKRRRKKRKEEADMTSEPQQAEPEQQKMIYTETPVPAGENDSGTQFEQEPETAD